jgi:hypothetical protein
MTTVSPIIHYCNGAVVRDGRLIRLGRSRGCELTLHLKTFARAVGLTPERLEQAYVRIAAAKAEGRWPDDPVAQTAVMNGRR